MDFVKVFNEMIVKISELTYGDDTNLDKINRKLELYIGKCFGKKSRYILDTANTSFYSYNFDNQQSQRQAWKAGQEQLINIVQVMIEDLELNRVVDVKEVKDSGQSNEVPKSIFLVHGHDQALKEEVARFVEKLGLDVIILHEQASGGKTIIEKFEDFSQVGFAIVLLSPDDEIVKTDQKGEKSTFYRARQNVIFEMAFFIGALGRSKVFSLLKGDKIDIPSDYSGVVYTSYDSGKWKMELIKEMKNVGYDIDANLAF
jgi:predicted nucleotide-binding protein